MRVLAIIQNFDGSVGGCFCTNATDFSEEVGPPTIVFGVSEDDGGNTEEDTEDGDGDDDLSAGVAFLVLNISVLGGV